MFSISSLRHIVIYADYSGLTGLSRTPAYMYFCQMNCMLRKSQLGFFCHLFRPVAFVIVIHNLIKYYTNQYEYEKRVVVSMQIKLNALERLLLRN